MKNETTVQNITPVDTITSSSTDSLTQSIQQTTSADQTVINYGKYHEYFGYPPKAPFSVIHPPEGIIEHYIPDMTVEIHAGTTLETLQEYLKQNRQWLPIDGIPHDTSLGEIVAHQTHGSLRCGYGTTRDMLLGLTYINDEGERIKVGGRTVKNVAGYDVTRLMVGQANTMGLISKLILRTWPTPQQWLTVYIRNLTTDFFDQYGTELLTSDAAPTTLTYTQNQSDSYITLSYEGTQASCQVQYNALVQFLHDHCANSATLDHTTFTHCDFLVKNNQRDTLHWNHDAVLKLIVPPAKTGQFSTLLKESPATPQIIEAQLATGTLLLCASWSHEEASIIHEWIENHNGFKDTLRIWLKQPLGQKLLAPMSPPQSDWKILNHLTNTLAPNGWINPGRLW